MMNERCFGDSDMTLGRLALAIAAGAALFALGVCVAWLLFFGLEMFGPPQEIHDTLGSEAVVRIENEGGVRQ